jgi:GAF domain-containing protein
VALAWKDLAEQLGIITALAVPVHHNGALVGALMVLNRSDGTEFTPADEQALVDYAQTLATAIHIPTIKCRQPSLS